MTGDEREAASHMAMELLNWFGENHGDLQPKPLADCLIVGLAMLIRISFRSDHEQIERALHWADRDLRETLDNLQEVKLIPVGPAGHA